MMKRRIVWIGLIACICLLAGQLTLNATGVTANVQPVSDQSEKVLPTPTGATALDSKAAVGTLKDSGERARRTSKVEAGALSAKSSSTKGPRQFETKSVAVNEGYSKASVKFMAKDINGTAPRRGVEALDDACSLVFGSSGLSGWTGFAAGNGIVRWVDPANCTTNPGYPFLIQDIALDMADYFGFGGPAGSGTGTLTYRVNIRCTADGLTDPCVGPGQIICTSGDLQFAMADEGLHTVTATMNCCVSGPFFLEFVLVDWSGPSNLPSPLWDGGEEVACLQYILYGGSYYDGYDEFFTEPIGAMYFTVNGNTQDACTPIACAPTTGACCDVSTGTCVDGVLESECDGLNEYFYPDETCAELDPPCAECIPEANDFCGNAIALTLGTQYCGDVDCYLRECEDDLDGVWHSFTTTECLNVTIDFCGSGGSPDAYANIFDGCPCAAGNAIGYSSATDCGDGNYAITWSGLPAGTYYVAVVPSLFPNYCITVSGTPCTVCESEGFLTLDCQAPQQVTGTTIGEDDDCNDGIPTFVYELTVSEAGLYNFDLCNTDPSWDSYIWVSDECCGDAICVSDDGCGVEFGLSSIVCCDLDVGTYYLHISGYGTTDEGAYTLDISCCDCEVVCTNNEGETTCADEYVDNYNGGCNSDPNVWYEYTCGTEICGESGNFLLATENYRDTDWYRLVLTEEQFLTWKVVTQFTASIYLLVPGGTAGYECDPDSIGALAGGTIVPCDTATISGCLPAGEYWLFVSTADPNQGTPCGTPYYFYTTCDVCPDCTPDYSISVDCEGYTGTGNTDFAGDDCEFENETQDGDTHNDEIWAIEILEAGEYRFSLCNTDPSWDTFMFLTTECCGGTYLNNYETSDDGCGVSGGPSMTACIPLEPGIVYLMVEGWSAADSGAYTLEIECCDPCIVECTDTELEGDCFDGYDDDFNAGCNMLPNTPSFSQNFNNAGPWPQTVCGTSGTHTDGLGEPVRDTDWYEFNLTDTALVNLSGVGEFPLTILIVQDTSAIQACSSYVITSDVADPCSLASIEVCLRPGRYFAWASVSSGFDADCGSSYEITLDIEYGACVLLPPAPEECPEEYTMFAQLFNGSSAGTSEIDIGGGTIYKRFENFSGAIEPICDVHWWGIEQVHTTDWEPCHEINMDFVITFHTDSSGYPTGVPVCSYTRTIAGAPTTRLFNGDPVYYYETVLNIDPDLCCELTDGWVSIQGAGATDCWFLWHTSIDGDFSSAFAYNGVWQDNYANDLAVCLTQAPPPCDPAENLTVYLTTGLGNPHLRWYAPITEDWLIYKSTDPNNTGDIDDPSYTYQTTVTGTGDLEWIDPAAFAGGDSYVNYIVVPSCYEVE